MRDICSALLYLEHSNIPLRAVSCRNILLNAARCAKLSLQSTSRYLNGQVGRTFKVGLYCVVIGFFLPNRIACAQFWIKTCNYHITNDMNLLILSILIHYSSSSRSLEFKQGCSFTCYMRPYMCLLLNHPWVFWWYGARRHGAHFITVMVQSSYLKNSDCAAHAHNSSSP